MKVNELTGFIPNGGFYNSTKWYIAICNQIENVVKIYHGGRELFTDKIEEVKEKVNALFIVNSPNYERMFDALTADYNPLWNVDGVEKLEYTRTNTGTQGFIEKHTGTQGTQGSNTGTQTTATTNSSSTGFNGQTTGTNTNFKTSFDSSIENETEKESISNSEIDTTTFSDTGNTTRTDNLSNNSTRTDNLQDTNDRTDNLKEEYTETKTRGGNIGVTKSTDLVESELDLRAKYNFMLIVSKDIAEFISYSC